ncbi:hypothetical protein EG68_06998 [Paragonimus skrjabini miyazakii]|uniref:Uncharacterized protein n=1 Tax=Paragonimus skrjabini miyazakii TaxID=59628 RepID=A0A8S9YW79_9TREM|nr:hypothetical protein EG68_06998 [Paragonimus skrjabini miyazakii]
MCSLKFSDILLCFLIATVHARNSQTSLDSRLRQAYPNGIPSTLIDEIFDYCLDVSDNQEESGSRGETAVLPQNTRRLVTMCVARLLDSESGNSHASNNFDRGTWSGR